MCIFIVKYIFLYCVIPTFLFYDGVLRRKYFIIITSAILYRWFFYICDSFVVHLDVQRKE